jgi:threonine dehydrogenase-like Zn-dependent dehydrogenase
MVDFTVFKGLKGSKIIKSQTRKELSNDEVLIKVTYSGVCGTDQHYKEADMVLGHEGAGAIEVSPLSPLDFIPY